LATRTNKIRVNSARTDEHRIMILDAAAECFMRDGFEAATIDEIAAAIGSSKGLIYYSFKSKADLFFAVYERSIERALVDLVPLAASDGTAIDRLRRVCQRHVHLLMETLPYHVVTRMGIESHLSRAMTPTQRNTLVGLKKLRDHYEKLFADLIQEGVGDCSLRKINVSLAAKTVLGAINSVSIWYRPRKNETRAERHAIAVEVSEIVISGLSNGANRSPQ